MSGHGLLRLSPAVHLAVGPCGMRSRCDANASTEAWRWTVIEVNSGGMVLVERVPGEHQHRHDDRHDAGERLARPATEELQTPQASSSTPAGSRYAWMTSPPPRSWIESV